MNKSIGHGDQNRKLSFNKLIPVQRCHSRESGNPLNGHRWIPTVVYPREDGGQDDGPVLEDGSYPYLFINLQKCGGKEPDLIGNQPFSRRLKPTVIENFTKLRMGHHIESNVNST